jgi:hypothetical protein
MRGAEQSCLQLHVVCSANPSKQAAALLLDWDAQPVLSVHGSLLL